MPALAAAGLRVAFTTRFGGWSAHPFDSLNLSFVSGDDPARVRANRERVLGALGMPAGAWTSGRQVHGAGVSRATRAERGAGAGDPSTTLPHVDALWTDEPGIAIAVLAADCVPVLLADPDGRRIAVVHAGWRGLVAGVVERAAEAMGRPERLRAFIGPSVGPCCYRVGEEVARAVREALSPAAVRQGAAPRLDLWLGAVVSARRAGVREIRPAALCTRCEAHRFFSHRAGARGRQGLVAAVV
ncbi:MAG: peptidoglycan editing factor PgeF [Acidobacteria bacterium]|nr:peptidoglycan editing factor PgeF [Acidobacteriota bacterium]